MHGSPKQALLVVDAEPSSLRSARRLFERGFLLHTAASAEDGLAILGRQPQVSVVLADRGPGDAGLSFLRTVRKQHRASCVLASPQADLEAVLAAVNDGTLAGCVAKPWNADEVEAVVRRAAEQCARMRELIEQRDLFSSLLESLPDGVYFKDRDHRYIHLNRAAARYLGIERPDEAIGRAAPDMLPMEVAELGNREDARILELGVTVEDRVRRRTGTDGVTRWTSTTKAPVLDSNGTPYRIVGVVRDVTDRLRTETENALVVQIGRTIQAKSVETALACAVGSICERLEWPYGEAWRRVEGTDELTVCHGWAGQDRRMQRFHAFSESHRFAIGEGLPGRVWRSGRPLRIDDLTLSSPSVFRRHRIAVESGIRSALAVPVAGEAGECLAVMVFFALQPGAFADDRLVDVVRGSAAQLGVLLDRQMAMEAMRQSEQRFRDFSEIASDYMTESGPDLRLTHVSENFDNAAGRPAEEILGRARWELDWLQLEAGQSWPEMERVFQEHRPFRNYRYWIRRPDGGRLCLLANGKPYFDANGNFAGYRTTGRDITDEVRALDALRQKQSLLENILASIPQYVFWKDRSSTFMGCNRLFAEFLGFDSPEKLIGKTDFDLGVPEADARFFRSIDAKVMETGEAILDLEETIHRPDGSVATLRTSKVPLRDDDGSIIGMLGVFADITEHRMLAAQLSHAQKMDAVGQLTGGVAHDFNNLLTVIIGNLQLLERDPCMDERALTLARRALGSAQRGADLTRRLLAFSRRQVLEPTVVDVDKLVTELGPLIRRTLGENMEVDVVSRETGLCAKIDAAQFETSLLNLAINARDAMPDGGKLTIVVDKAAVGDDYSRRHLDLAPGEYVQVSVTDTGTGIPPEILHRVFEPFFTTKEIGKGTGLGLSMIFGFVKQSGGHVSIYSEPGIGTTVRLYIPRATEPASAAVADDREDALASGEETILIVEDNEEVRATVTAALRASGYRILQAGAGKEALQILEREEGVGLMITDIVMPGGMNGAELAQCVRQRWPRIAILMVSGYPREALARNGDLLGTMSFMTKPFRNQDLARRVRELLDAGM